MSKHRHLGHQTHGVNKPRCPSAHERIKIIPGILFTHKKGKRLTPTTWVALENTMLVKETRHRGHILCNVVHVECPNQATP